jgi:hypothetical protein
MLYFRRFLLTVGKDYEEVSCPFIPQHTFQSAKFDEIEVENIRAG